MVGEPLADGSLLPALTWTAPEFDWRTTIAIGVPLYLVTMTGQNIPGVAVLESFGYRTPLRSALTWAGASTVVTAPAGGFSINLAAISAALAAGPEAGPDRDRRWIAGVTCGVVYVLLAPLSVLVTAVSAAAPAGIIASVGGRRADRHLRRLGVGGAVRRAPPRGGCGHVPGRRLRPVVRGSQPGVLGAGRGWPGAAGAPPAPGLTIGGRPVVTAGPPFGGGVH